VPRRRLSTGALIVLFAGAAIALAIAIATR
jgi:hypothetical protein